MAEKEKVSTRDHTKLPAKVMACGGCNSHPFQDERYGKGKRLHNPRKGDRWVCTVCGSIK